MISISTPQVKIKTLAVWFFLIGLLLQACSHHSKLDPASISKVPAPLVKKWYRGEFPLDNFWNYQGTFTGKTSELGMAFDFKPNGECEFFRVTGNNANGCRTELLVYQKGTVEFHPNQSFTFYPIHGNKREFVKVCDTAYQNYDHQASSQDLTPQTYYYTFEPNGFGQDQLIIRGGLQLASETTLVATNW